MFKFLVSLLWIILLGNWVIWLNVDDVVELYFIVCVCVFVYSFLGT